MSWMNSARAHHLHEEHTQAEAEATKSADTTETEALRAYKYAHVIDDPRTRRQLEAQAKAQGWTSLGEYKSAVDARRTAHAEVNRRIAGRITTPEEAARERQKALTNGDKQLASAITETVTERGWTAQMTQASRPPKSFEEYAAELNDQLTGLVTAHNTTSAQFRDDLRAKRITSEYVATQTQATATARMEQLNSIRQGVDGYVNEARESYDSAYRALMAATGDTNEQLLAEMRATKAWDRISRELSALPAENLTEGILSRVRDADPGTLRAIIEEAPSFLAGRGLANAEEMVRSLVATRPELSDAHAQVSKATKLRDVVTHNTKHIEEHLNSIGADDVTPDTWTAYVDPTTVNY